MSVDDRTWMWVGGRVVPAREATVAALDHGVTVGDGVFETAKVVDGAPFAMRRHLDRLRRSATTIGLPVPWTDDDLRGIAAEVIAAAGLGAPTVAATVPVLGRLRVTITGGVGPLGSDRGDAPPTLLVSAGPMAAPTPTTDVATVPWVRNERSAVAGAKTTSYADNVVALARARAEGASEAVLANTLGALCEGTGSNVFVVVDGRLCTPALSTGCLAGVTRALVCELLEVDERDDLTLDDLRVADEAFLTSSTRDVQPIAHVDGRRLADVPGPHTVAAADALAALARRTADP